MVQQHLDAVAQLKRLTADLRKQVGKYRAVRDRMTDMLYEADFNLRAVGRQIQKLELTTEVIDEDAWRKLFRTVTQVRTVLEQVFPEGSSGQAAEQKIESAAPRPVAEKRTSREGRRKKTTTRRITLDVREDVASPDNKTPKSRGRRVSVPSLRPQLNAKGEVAIHPYAVRLINASINRNEGLPKTPQEAAFATWGRDWENHPITVARGYKDVEKLTVGQDLRLGPEKSFVLSRLSAGLSNLANSNDPNLKVSNGLKKFREELEQSDKLKQAFAFGSLIGVI